MPSITGMKDYLRAFGDHLAMQNKKSLSHLKRELSSFYGTNDFLSHLKDLGSKALSKSTINGPQRTKEITSIVEVGNVSDCNIIFRSVIPIGFFNIFICFVSYCPLYHSLNQ